MWVHLEQSGISAAIIAFKTPNSLAGLELQESLLPLSDLCCHALRGHRRHPGVTIM